VSFLIQFRMHDEETTSQGAHERWVIAVRVDIHGPETPGGRGSSRRLARCLEEAELSTLDERLRRATEEYLGEIEALPADEEEGWFEELADGSWALEQ
jgi:hypothetical protein